MHRFSLQQQLTLPFVVLVIFVSVGIGWVSFRAGESAVNDLTRKVLVEMTGRIGYATEQNLTAALVALESVAPDPSTIPQAQPFSEDPQMLEQRFWAASGLFIAVNYVYFGGVDGRFIGVNRVQSDRVELLLRGSGAEKRQTFLVRTPGDHGAILRNDNFDPRTRPWYGIAIAHKEPVWSHVYNDFRTKEPVITLAKSVYRADQSFAGVMATDLRLKALSDFLRTLEVSKNGVAFVVDGQGVMVATSGSELPVKMLNNVLQRRLASDMDNPLIRDAFSNYTSWRKRNQNFHQPQTGEFATSSGKVEMAAAVLGEKYGIDWITVVAVPRSDFMAGVTRSFYQSLAIAGFCIIIALVFGWSALNRVLGDIQELTNAARKVGNGEPLPELTIRRTDEIGLLAQTFSEMEHNLRVDRLTGVFNRESLHAQIGFMQRQAALQLYEKFSFALLFIDLDRFKLINDQYGHGAGDFVLKTVAARLKNAVRESDVVVRYGGDEFVVLLKGVTSLCDVNISEEKIRIVLENPIELEGGAATVGASLGWAIFPQDGEDPHALLKIADVRMFDDKRNRRQAR